MLVRQFLDTTHVLWPTFHLPSFLSSLVSIKSEQDPVFMSLTVAIAFMSLRARRTRRDLSEDTGIELYHTCESREGTCHMMADQDRLEATSRVASPRLGICHFHPGEW